VLNNRNAFAVTRTVAPVSDRMAIQSFGRESFRLIKFRFHKRKKLIGAEISERLAVEKE